MFESVKEVRIGQFGQQVHLILVSATQVHSDGMRDEILRQLKSGVLHLTLGRPASVIEEGGVG